MNDAIIKFSISSEQIAYTALSSELTQKISPGSYKVFYHEGTMSIEKAKEYVNKTLSDLEELAKEGNIMSEHKDFVKKVNSLMTNYERHFKRYLDHINNR